MRTSETLARVFNKIVQLKEYAEDERSFSASVD